MEKQEISFNQFFKLIKQNKKAVILITSIVTIGFLCFSFIMPYTYGVQTIIMPPKQESSLGGMASLLKDMPSSAGSMLGGMGKSTPSQTFIGILKSRSTVEYIIDKNDLSHNPFFKSSDRENLISNIQNSMDIDNTKDGFIYLRFDWKTGFFASKKQKDSLAHLTANIANDGIEALDKIIRKQSISKAKFSEEYISGEIKKYNERLDSIAIVLENYQKNNKLFEIDEQMKAILQQAVSSGEVLGKAQFDLVVAEQEFSAKSPQLQAIRSKYNAVLNQYKGIQSGGLTKGDNFSIPLKEIPELSRKYAVLFRDREVIEQVILYLEMQRHQEAIQASRDIPVVEVLDPAETPLKQSAPVKKFMIFGGLLIGFFISLIYISYTTWKKGKTKISPVD
jgi:LPS O-antigen subunit length determinant protein (WzzB/FepE family)